MKIVVALPYAPWPVARGIDRLVMNLIEGLSARHEVVLVTMALGRNDLERLAEPFDAGELSLPEGVEVASRSATSLRFRVEAPLAVNPRIVHELTSRRAPLVSFQEVSRKLEQVYLKTMADAQGVPYAA